MVSGFNSATPATFGSHIGSRLEENDIALHMIGNYTLGRRIDLMFGGGSCHFVPSSHPDSCRNDTLNVYDMAKGYGWNVHNGIADFEQTTKDSPLPILNLFATDMMSYGINLLV
jgi:alkaline phosphatase